MYSSYTYKTRDQTKHPNRVTKAKPQHSNSKSFQDRPIQCSDPVPGWKTRVSMPSRWPVELSHLNLEVGGGGSFQGHSLQQRRCAFWLPLDDIVSWKGPETRHSKESCRTSRDYQRSVVLQRLVVVHQCAMKTFICHHLLHKLHPESHRESL